MKDHRRKNIKRAVKDLLKTVEGCQSKDCDFAKVPGNGEAPCECAENVRLIMNQLDREFCAEGIWDGVTEGRLRWRGRK